ncbi:hypothetical protein NG895_05965 [Aeoliella sp. ICT_H6.2]|uniref:Uncharacterized protein n=1 Tax=Aeoliella straminimaris TaxID=2954799 RepID=A0A9X2F8B0_9BACT|nr:hypothetical protein [Aeoliella straminimaris]MCO6043447.1 hypothetical protein [Aeoliella straminimaris]
MNRSTEQWSPLRAARAPLIALGVTALFIFLFVKAAAELAAGQEADITGRQRGLKALLVVVLDTIGPTGVYIAGGVVGCLLLYWLVRRITNPPMVTTLTPPA